MMLATAGEDQNSALHWVDRLPSQLPYRAYFGQNPVAKGLHLVSNAYLNKLHQSFAAETVPHLGGDGEADSLAAAYLSPPSLNQRWILISHRNHCAEDLQFSSTRRGTSGGSLCSVIRNKYVAHLRASCGNAGIRWQIRHHFTLIYNWILRQTLRQLWNEDSRLVGLAERRNFNTMP